MPTAPKKKKRRLTVSVIGAGRLGTALARALFMSGYEIEAIVARRPARARRAASLLGTPTQALSATQLPSLPKSKTYSLALPMTTSQYRHLTSRGAEDFCSRTDGITPPRGAVVFRCPGPVGGEGFHTGSLHPLVSVSDPLSGADKLVGAFFCVEGDAAASRVARAIVRDLKGKGFHIASNDKPLYHAAAVMASGHTVALFSIATEVLTHAGLDPKTARRVLLSLLESTVANLFASEPARALTGTFARGDLATVKRHLAALSGKELTEAIAAYKLLGTRSLDLVSERLDPKIRKQILRY